MAIVPNNTNYQFGSNSGNSKDCFEEHNQRMRVFRLAHPKNWRQWGYGVPEGRGGLLALAPIAVTRGVVLPRNWQN